MHTSHKDWQEVPLEETVLKIISLTQILNQANHNSTFDCKLQGQLVTD